MSDPERGWIRDQLERFQAEATPGDVGIGDDAAVVGVPGATVLTTDAMVEGTHFRDAWLTDFELGYRAIAINYSDLAAMAATPIGVLLSIETPSLPHRFGTEFWDGVAEILEQFGGRVLGGNVTRTSGPAAIAVTAVGSVEPGREVRRDTAHAALGVYVTGRLGVAAQVREALDRGVVLADDARDPWTLPKPRIEEALALNDAGALHAAIDISDGLALDLSRLCEASGIGVALDRDSLLRIAPVDDRAVDLALGGGEDYELLFVGPDPLPKSVQELATRIGTTNDSGEMTLDDTSIRDVLGGWDPFR